jgi:plasmid maintenance system antidote protein VapI
MKNPPHPGELIRTEITESAVTLASKQGLRSS